MVYTGLSEVMGSWKIMEMRLPRIRRISASPTAARSLPSNRMRPAAMRPAGLGSRRRIESAVTLLPQPLSPTKPKVSRAAVRGPRRPRP